VPTTPDAPRHPHAVADATARHLDARLAAAQAEHRLPSLVAGLVRDGHLVWSGGAGDLASTPGPGGSRSGRPDADTQFRIGSITKTLVAVTVLKLRDAGLWSLEDPVTDHLPDAPTGRATIAQLLSHSAGLPAETTGPWWERTLGVPWRELLDRVDGPIHPPGRRFHYSNVGYGVLGELLARTRGTTWDQVVHDELLAPLGMTRTTTRPEPPAATGVAVHPWADVVLPEPEHDAVSMAPAGQLWSTIGDLARWATFLGGDTDGVLAPATLEEASRPIVVDDRPGEAWTAAHGLGLQVWNRDGVRSIGHGGSMPGFLAAIAVEIPGGDGVIVATNATAGLDPVLPGDLVALLAEHEPRPATPWRPRATSALDITGVWFWGPTPLVLRATEDGLDLAPVPGGTGRASRFRTAEDGTWVGRDGYYAGETLRTVRADDGTPSWLDLASFVLTRTPYDPTAEIPGDVDPAGWHAPPPPA
jgi:CubicO group peptidase (beta-lactamase class C family)